MADEEKTILIRIDVDNKTLNTELGETRDKLKSLGDLQKIFNKELENSRGTEEYEFMSEQVGKTEQEMKKLQQTAKETNLALKVSNAVPGSYDQLKASIALTKSQIDKLVIGSTEYKKKEEELLALENKRIDVEKQRASLFKERIKDALNEAESLKSLKASIKEYTNAAIEAGEHTAIGQEFLKKAGEAQDKLGDIKKTVKTLGDDEFAFKALAQGVTFAAASFATLNGAQALFGSKNEELEKTVRKLEGSIALLNGVKEISAALEKESALRLGISAVIQKIYNAQTVVATAVTSAYNGVIALFTGQMTIATAATNVLNVATKALLGPIGLVILAVGAIAGAVAYFSSSEKENTEELIKNTKATQENENAKRALQNRIEAIQDEINVSSGALSKGQKELNDIRRSGSDEIIKLNQETQNKLLETKKAFEDGDIKNYEEYQKKLKDITKQSNTEQKLLNEALFKEIELQRIKNNNEVGDEEMKKNLDKIKAQEDADKKAMELADKNWTAKWNQMQKELQAEKDFYIALANLKKRGEEEIEKMYQETRDRHSQNEQKQQQKMFDLQMRNVMDIENIRREADKQDFTGQINAFERKKQLLEDNRQALVLDLIREKNDRIKAGEDTVVVTKEINDKITETNKNAADANVNIAKEEAMLKQQVLVDGLMGAIGDLKTIAGDNAEAQKAFAVSEATISTYLSAQKAFQSLAGIPVVGPALGFAAAGLAVAAGIANINKIVNTDLPGAATGLLVGGEGPSIQRSNGDNMLVTVKRGEVILNDFQQSMLGGSDTFRRIGVPGFAGGGIAGTAVASIQSATSDINTRFETLKQMRMFAENIKPPVVGVEDIIDGVERVVSVRARVEI